MAMHDDPTFVTGFIVVVATISVFHEAPLIPLATVTAAGIAVNILSIRREAGGEVR